MSTLRGLDITSAADLSTAAASAELLTLPWDVRLEDWPEQYLAALPRGISRHVVRFAHLAGAVVAVKDGVSRQIIRRETEDDLFARETE